MANMPAISAATSFDQACAQVVEYLSKAVPMGYWSISRYDGTDQVYLAVADRVYGKVVGDRHAWSDSFCQFATDGRAPQIAPDAMAVPEYASAGVSQVLPIGSYVGIPVRREGGELFGTICGLDPAVHGEELAAQAPLLGLLAGLLEMILHTDEARAEQARAREQAEVRAETDPLTGVVNRRGWERFIALEEERYRRFGDPGSVVILDLDGLKEVNDTYGHGAGDDYLKRAAAALTDAVRGRDLVARLGGDEFGVLAVNTTPAQTERLVERLRAALTDAGTPTSVGAAPYTFVAGFPGAWEAADKAMYEDKRRRRAAASAS
ncbi:MAG TPA: sensor domain-containing diguanylate cyclase [Acidimicrobiales bacterium]|nr:sensor domain-containing diguanylate cyclase [Acidimicrobiales bacterium]